MKRCLKIMAALLLLAYGSAARADFEEVDGYMYEYQVEWDGTATIVSDEWGKPAIAPLPVGALAIPAELGGYPVAKLGNSAFYGCTNLTDVVIPPEVSYIGDSAFEDCAALTDVSIPDGVTVIGYSVFYGCTGLTNVVIGANVESLEGYVFYGCTGLTDVTIPASVTYAGYCVFAGCTGLTNVVIGTGVETIGPYAFSSCSSLAEISIPAGVTSIGNDAFNNTAFWNERPEGEFVCLSDWLIGYKGTLAEGALVLPEGIKGIAGGAFEGRLNVTSVAIPAGVAIIGNVAFRNCTGLTNVVIGADVETIGDVAFLGCTGLRDITIADNVTYIGVNAFADCTGLTNVAIGAGVEIINGSAFSGCTGLRDITIADNVTYIGTAAFSGCTGLTNVVIGAGVETIDSDAFSGCTGLTGVVIPPNVTSIGREAFSGCTGLTSMTIAATVGSLQASSFSGCTGLTDVTIGGNVGYIGGNIFTGMTSLTNVTIEMGVEAIGNNAFAGCTGLTAITIPGSVEYIWSSAFANCTGLTNVVLGAGVEYIADNAFSGCTGLTDLTIPGSVEYIWASAFANCTGLTNVVLGAGIEYIQDNAFSGCTGLTDVTIPGSVRDIGYSAFANCTGLTNVVIGAGVEYISDFAFAWCTGLEDVTIPGSVRNIGYGAFVACTGLTNVVIEVGVKSIGNSAFEDCSNLAAVTIPDSVTNIGQDAFAGTAFWDNMADDAVIYIGDRAVGYKGTLPAELVIQDGTRIIDAGAFKDCLDFTSVVIPDSVVEIRDDAFSGCTGLLAVTIPDSVETIGEEAFVACTGLTNVVIGTGVEYIGEFAFGGCTGLADITIPDNVLHVDSGVFYGCNGLTNVVIGAGLQYISYYMFEDCTGLVDVTIPDNIYALWEDAFRGCTSLTNVVIGANMQHIDYRAFYGCTSLEAANIPASVTYIGYEAFAGTAFWNNSADDTVVYLDGWALGYKGTLPEVLVFEDGTKGIAVGAFSECEYLKDVTIPGSVSSIGEYAFSYCTSLTNVVIEAGVESIGYAAFMDCEALASASIPESVTYIGNAAFYGTALMDNQPDDGVIYLDGWAIGYKGTLPAALVIEDGTKGIAHGAFYDCYDIESVVIPEGVIFIGDSAFYWCGNLAAANIPDSVTHVGYGAFRNTALEDDAADDPVFYLDGWALDYKGTLPAELVLQDGTRGIAAQAFAECDLINVVIPASVRYIGDYPFGWCDGLQEVYFLGDAPQMVSDLFYYAAPDSLTTYVRPDSTGWDGPGSTTLPDLWPLTGVDRRAIAYMEIPGTYLSDPVATAAVMTTTTYAGFAYDEDGTMRGTMTLSAKATVRTSKGVTTTNWTFTAKAVLQNATVSFSAKAWDNNEPGNLRIVTRTSEVLNVRVEGDRFWGELSGGKVGATLTVDGARDVFANRKDVEAQARLLALKGYYTTALLLNEMQEPAGYLTLTIGNLGAVKYAGKMKDGTSVSGSVKLLEGLNEDGWYAVGIHKPLYSKKGFMGGLLWLDPADQVLRVDADEGWFVDWVCADPKKTPVNEKLDVCGGYFGDGKTGIVLAASYGFSMVMPENLPAPAATLVSGEWMVEALPLDLTATVTGVKFVFPKAATPKKDKATGLYDYALENPSGLKLTYTARTGLFKGSFKMYYDGLTNRDVLQHKTVTVSYTGVLTPVRDGAFAELPVGLGTGTATINRQKTGMPVYLLNK